MTLYSLGFIFVASVLSLIYLFLIFFNGVWQPIMIAYLIYSIFNPLAQFLLKYKIKVAYTATLALIICYSSILLLILEIIPIAQHIVETLIVKAPLLVEYATQIQTNKYIEHMIHEIIQYIQSILKSFLREGSSVIYSGASYCVISPLISFYMIIRRQHIKKMISHFSYINEILFAINQYWRKYIIHQVYICLMMALYYSSLLYLFNVQYCIQIGIIIGIITFIPYIGFIIGFLISATTILIYHKVSLLYSLAGIFIVGQIIENMVLVPFLMGNNVASSPLTIIVVMLFTNHLLGFTGTMLSLPTVCCMQGLWKWWSIKFLKRT